MAQPQTVLDLLMRCEQASNLVDRRLLYQTLDQATTGGVLTLIIFSCLATEPGQEELKLDLFETLFFKGRPGTLSKKVREVVGLTLAIERLGLNVQVVPILVDTEPRRTWGWNTPQEELTGLCQIMLDDATAEERLPTNWRPTLWSTIERAHSAGEWTFEKSLAWAKGVGKHRLQVSEQVECLSGFSDRFHFPLGLEATAENQVGAYAHEGKVLEMALPDAILLQSESPYEQKDRLYQWHRENPLPIVHPFPR